MKLIIFDIDGTLCHSKYADDQCFINTFKIVYGIKLKNTNWESYNHATELNIVKQILKEFKRNSDDDSINKIIEVYTNEIRSSLQNDVNSFTEIPGAKQLIEFLNNTNEYTIGIATGGFLKPAKFKLTELGFNFNNIPIFSSDGIITKFEIITQLIKYFRDKFNTSDFDKIIYVGYRKYDYDTTVELGIDFIGIDYERNNNLKEIGIKNVLNDYFPINNFLSLL